PELLGARAAGDDQGRGPVADLAGVAGGDGLVTRHRAQLGEALGGRVGADALVGGDAGALLVEALLAGEGDDLALEPAVPGRLRGALVALGAEAALLGAADLVFLGDVVGRVGHAPALE